MRHLVIAIGGVSRCLPAGSLTAQRKPYRGVNDTYPAPQFTSRAGWNIRAAHLESWFSRRPGFCRCPSARR